MSFKLLWKPMASFKNERITVKNIMTSFENKGFPLKSKDFLPDDSGSSNFSISAHSWGKMSEMILK